MSMPMIPAALPPMAHAEGADSPGNAKDLLGESSAPAAAFFFRVVGFGASTAAVFSCFSNTNVRVVAVSLKSEMHCIPTSEFLVVTRSVFAKTILRYFCPLDIQFTLSTS
jgi:hypothetical protein